MVALTLDRKEEQELVEAVRDGDTIAVRLRERTFTPEEFRDLQRQFKRTAWLATDKEQLESEKKHYPKPLDVRDEGECHECGFEGLMVENEIGTTYCPKCRSTNVGWPVVEKSGLNSKDGDN